MSCSFDSDRPRRLVGSATASATSAEPLPFVPALRLLAAARPPRFATARPPEPPRTLPLFAIMPFPTSHSRYPCAYRSHVSWSLADRCPDSLHTGVLPLVTKMLCRSALPATIGRSLAPADLAAGVADPVQHQFSQDVAAT